MSNLMKSSRQCNQEYILRSYYDDDNCPRAPGGPGSWRVCVWERRRNPQDGDKMMRNFYVSIIVILFLVQQVPPLLNSVWIDARLTNRL